MFYDIFKKLCDDRGITTTKASHEIGFSKGSVTYWRKLYKSGKDVKPDSYTAAKIADFFGVSVDYLLGRTDDPIDYDEDGDALAEIPLTYMEAANGDPRLARAIMRAVDLDAMREGAGRAKSSAILRKYDRLDAVDQAKVEAYMDGLLSAEKYQNRAEVKDA